MKIHLFNSMSKEKELFVPIDPSNVKVYYCGPTVYDFIHIGNLRAFLTADVLVRTLRTKYNVTFVRNITDIDDKIINRAMANNESIKDLTDRTITDFIEDTSKAGILSPDIQPRASEYIQHMIDMTTVLLENGFAYISQDGKSILFDSSKSNSDLSGRKNMTGVSSLTEEEQREKRNSSDFAIWRPSIQGGPTWETPWGNFSPGWHSECAVMSMSLLGERFDIHGGGQDLFFPHHECEDSLCRAVNDTKNPMANYWVHNSMLNVEGKKMSKSLGNFLTIRDVLDKVHPEVLRMFLLSSHYRTPMNFTWDSIDRSKKLLDRLYRFKDDDGQAIPESSLISLYNDLDTPTFLAELNVLSHQAAKGDKAAARTMTAAAKFIGLLRDENYFKGDADTDLVEQLIERRSKAKLDKDWATADLVRRVLNEKGIILEDTKEGTTWRKK